MKIKTKTIQHANVKVIKPGNSKDIFEYYNIFAHYHTYDTHTYTNIYTSKKKS